MQVSIVNYKSLTKDFRIDADYYKPEYLKEDLQRNRYKNLKLSEIAFIADGQHGYHEVDASSPISHVTAKNAKGWFANTEGADRLAKWVDDNNKRSSLQVNDLILSTRGTVGFCAIVTKEILPANIDQDVARINIRDKKLLPQYLLSYLNCKVGQDWLGRNKTGMVQQGLPLTAVRNIPIPLLGETFQYKISNLIIMSYQELSQSRKNVSDAEQILLEELGLADWKPKHFLSFVRNYSETGQAGRIDAEYFQPKYDEIINAVKKYKCGWDTLGSLVSIKKCVEVGSGEYLDKGIPFIRVSNISPFEITEEKYISEKLYSELTQHQPKQGEILFSKDATPGIAYHLNSKPPKMIPSGGILRLKLKDNWVNEDYLTLVLNSLITKEQINRDVGGSVILHWRPDQVKETLIPLLSKDKQKQIQQKISESFNLRKQSKHLLECAKKAVEMAIEKDEATAMKWIDNQMQS